MRKRKKFTLKALSETRTVNLTMYILKHVEHVCRSRAFWEWCKITRLTRITENLEVIHGHSYLILKETALQQSCDLLKVTYFL